MKFILCGINAKYIHSNLAVYSLKKYAEIHGPDSAEFVIREYTINHYVEDILQDLYEERGDVLVMSCYIWNVRFVREIAEEIRKIRPEMPIWIGGPEVTYEPEAFLCDCPAADLIMQGEGERVFTDLVSSAELYQGAGESGAGYRESMSRNLPLRKGLARDIFPEKQGLVYREVPGDQKSQIVNNGFAPLMNLDEVPFVYDDVHLFQHKIIYYETSRGCPFSCTYCLSSVEQGTRFRSENLVAEELQKFLDAGVPQVKFVDRTFNCNPNHAMFIWRYIHEHDNGITNFHFEISSDLLTEEALDLFARMRPGLIQLEIGLQTTYEPAMDAIERHMNLDRLFANVERVHKMRNIHQHIDLIAGLPYEDYGHFTESFNDLYRCRPDQLQLGFLKVLKGTRMKREAKQYGILWRSETPYEVLSTRWLSYEDIIRLKGVEELVEMYYNSGQYTYTLEYAVPKFDSPFQFYEAFAAHYRGKGYHKVSHSRLEKYEILRAFLKEQEKEGPYLDEVMLYDLYLRENVKARPTWAPDLSKDKKMWKQLYRERGEKLFPGKEDYDSRKAANLSHIERFHLDVGRMVEHKEFNLAGGPVLCLFDYTERSPLDAAARTIWWSEGEETDSKAAK